MDPLHNIIKNENAALFQTQLFAASTALHASLSTAALHDCIVCIILENNCLRKKKMYQENKIHYHQCIARMTLRY